MIPSVDPPRLSAAGDQHRRTGSAHWRRLVPILMVPGVLASGCPQEAGPANRSDPENVVSKRATDEQTGLHTDDVPPGVATFCGDCHAVPLPETFPRDAWFAEVEQGYRFYRESGRTDLEPPPMKVVTAYYRDLAPESLEIPEFEYGQRPSPVTFNRQIITLAEGPATVGVSNLNWCCPSEGECRLIVSDMANGPVRTVRFQQRQVSDVHILGDGNHPAHAEIFDWNQDERLDVIVSGLGSPLPADHDRGSVLMLSFSGDTTPPVMLLEGLGRVADARPGDFTGDGTPDLIVAEFGWRSSGSIRLLVGTPGDPTTFEDRVIDPRHGAIHVPVVDLDSDGDLDFLALISQEHEQIVAFLNQGNGQFDRAIVFDAGDPSYGSSGMELADVDADGDVDIIYTNGDTLDSYVVKPYHAVHWLENQGSFPFLRHTLIHLPGAARATAGDLDADGDLDIAACTFLPARILKTLPPGQADLPSALWLEQTPAGFETHILESGACRHLTMELGDFDGDGRLDIAAGHYTVDKDSPDPAWLTIWWNEGQASAH